MPVLMQAMKCNASTRQGAEGLLGALSDGSVIDDVAGMVLGRDNKKKS